jgi:hypothetical protein
MKSLDIIIRTHDKSNVSKFPRFISVSKRELIEGCMTSLINSANQCKNKINIIVLDDHSSTIIVLKSFFVIFKVFLRPQDTSQKSFH